MFFRKVITVILLGGVCLFGCNTQSSETESDMSEEGIQESEDAVEAASDAVDNAYDDMQEVTENVQDPEADEIAAEGAQNFYLDADGNVVYTFLMEENMPRFASGNLNDYLQENLKYPIKSRENESEGTVIVNFIVAPDGMIHSAEVIKATDDELLNAEALRVVQEMPKWTPGMKDGKPVSYKYSLPVSFRLKQ